MPDVTITKLPDPSGFSPDPLSDVIWDGARTLIEQTIEEELAMADGRFKFLERPRP